MTKIIKLIRVGRTDLKQDMCDKGYDLRKFTVSHLILLVLFNSKDLTKIIKINTLNDVFSSKG